MEGCQEITERIEKSNVTKLTFKERWSIRMHLFMCKTCRVFKKDSQLMNRLLKKNWDKKEQHSYSEAEKMNLKSSLESGGNS